MKVLLRVADGKPDRKGEAFLPSALEDIERDLRLRVAAVTLDFDRSNILGLTIPETVKRVEDAIYVEASLYRWDAAFVTLLDGEKLGSGLGGKVIARGPDEKSLLHVEVEQIAIMPRVYSMMPEYPVKRA